MISANALISTSPTIVLASVMLSACVPSVPSAPSAPSATISSQVLEQEAKAITQQFVGTLLPTLQQAMENGGPVNAIEVCSIQAPLIANNLGNVTGWQVSRVSLKARNNIAAIPDPWETEMLNQFNQRQHSGEAGAQINASARVDGEYRFMQAQPVMPLCLTCHGTNLSAEVRNALSQRYPDDMATGYRIGEIRGAISLLKTLEN